MRLSNSYNILFSVRNGNTITRNTLDQIINLLIEKIDSAE